MRVARAERAARDLSRTDFEQRAGWMRRAADILESESESCARTITREMGKPISASRAEVTKCVRTMRFYADHAKQMLADEPLADPQSVGARNATARYRPLGVVLAVMPWNYPLWQVIRFAAPALMAGNTGLLKHASNVPESALYLDALFTRAGFPTGAFATLLIESDRVRDVIRDRRVSAVTLTGSEAAGRAVAVAAASEIKKSVLELGGSDPFIVMPTADIESAVQSAVTARTLNNGQSCIAAKRFIVHEDVYARFQTLFVAALAELRMGDPQLEDTELGPLATKSGRDELVALVEDARASGARILIGGEVPSVAGWYYPATVVSDVTAEMRLFSEETFGPVAVLHRVRDVESAIALANATSFGLSCSVWTARDDERRAFEEGIDAGAVFVGGMTVSHPELPFGGVKRSGYGRELSAAGIREFCNLKTIWEA